MNILTELRKGLCFLVGRFVKFSCCNVSGKCNKWSIAQSMTEKKPLKQGFFLMTDHFACHLFDSSKTACYTVPFEHKQTAVKISRKKSKENQNGGEEDWLDYVYCADPFQQELQREPCAPKLSIC